MNANYGLSQSPTGWQTAESFLAYLRKLNEELNTKKVKRPVLLFVDNHASHITYLTRKWCRENGIILITFYPNSTHILQMCDTSIFGPVKDKWITAIQRYRVSSNYALFEEVAFVKVLKQMNDEAIKPQSIINGFRMTGIYPFNKRAVDYSKCISTRQEIENEDLSGEIDDIGKVDITTVSY